MLNKKTVASKEIGVGRRVLGDLGNGEDPLIPRETEECAAPVAAHVNVAITWTLEIKPAEVSEFVFFARKPKAGHRLEGAAALRRRHER